MIYGYARVSTKGQAADGNSLESQRETILAKYSNAEIYEEAFTGATTDRPVFNSIVEKMQEGDMLVVVKLDRLARNTIEGLQIVQKLFEKKCSIHVMNVGLLEDTPMGQFFVTTLLAVAQLERTQIIERTQAGKEVAKQRPDYHEGRVYIDKKDEVRKYLEKTKKGELSVSEACKTIGISRAKWYTTVKEVTVLN